MPDQITEQKPSIYSFLKENGLTDKSEQDFNTTYADSAKAKELYSFFTENELTSKDFDTFYQDNFNGLAAQPTATERFNSSLPYVYTEGEKPIVVGAVNSKKDMSFDQNAIPQIGSEKNMDKVIPQEQSAEQQYYNPAVENVGGAQINTEHRPEESFIFSSPEEAKYEIADNLLERSQKQIDAATGKGNSTGVVDALTDRNFWTLGGTDVAMMVNLKKIANKLENNESLSESDKYLLDAWNKSEQVNQQYPASKANTWYTVGKSITDMVPWLIQFASTKGLGGTVTKGIETTLRANAEKYLGKTIAIGLSKGLAETAGAYAAASLMPNTFSDITRRTLGETYKDEAGNIQFNGESADSNIKAIYKGWTSGMLEVLTERLGEGLGGMLVTKWPKSKLVKFIAGEGGLNATTNVSKFTRSVGWDGAPMEYLEEFVNTPLNALLVGDSKYSDVFDGKQQLETLLTVVVMGQAMRAVNSTQNKMVSLQADRDYRSAKALFDTELDQDVRTLITDVLNSDGSLEEQGSELHDLLSTLDSEKAGIALNYIVQNEKFNQRQRGYQQQVKPLTPREQKQAEISSEANELAHQTTGTIVVGKLTTVGTEENTPVYIVSGEQGDISGAVMVRRLDKQPFEDGKLTKMVSPEMVVEKQETTKEEYIQAGLAQFDQIEAVNQEQEKIKQGSITITGKQYFVSPTEFEYGDNGAKEFKLIPLEQQPDGTLAEIQGANPIYLEESKINAIREQQAKDNEAVNSLFDERQQSHENINSEANNQNNLQSVTAIPSGDNGLTQNSQNQPAPTERKITPQKFGSTVIDIIEGEEFDEVVPNERVSLEKALPALEKEFKDNLDFEVVTEKVQVEIPAENKYKKPTFKTEIRSIKIVPKSVLEEARKAEQAKAEEEAKKAKEQADNIHNKLVREVNNFNSLTDAEKRRFNTSGISQQAANLGYLIKYDKGNIVITDKGKSIGYRGKNTPQDAIDSHKGLTDYPQEVQLTASYFLSPMLITGVDLNGLTPLKANQAILDIQAGKKTVDANHLLDVIENIHNTGIVKLKSDSRTGFSGADIPMDEYISLINEEITPEEENLAALIPDDVAMNIFNGSLTPEILDQFENLIFTPNESVQNTNRGTEKSVPNSSESQKSKTSSEEVSKKLAEEQAQKADNLFNELFTNQESLQKNQLQNEKPKKVDQSPVAESGTNQSKNTSPEVQGKGINEGLEENVSDQVIIAAHKQIDEFIEKAQKDYDQAQGLRQKYIQDNGYPEGNDPVFDKLVTNKVDAENRLNKLITAKGNLLPLPTISTGQPATDIKTADPVAEESIQEIIDNADYKPRHKNGKIVRLSVSDVLTNQEPSFKVERGGQNEMKGRIDKAKQFLESNPKELEAASIYFRPDGTIGFEDGRHRTVASQELGAEFNHFEITDSPEQNLALDKFLKGESWVIPEVENKNPKYQQKVNPKDRARADELVQRFIELSSKDSRTTNEKVEINEIVNNFSKLNLKAEFGEDNSLIVEGENLGGAHNNIEPHKPLNEVLTDGKKEVQEKQKLPVTSRGNESGNKLNNKVTGSQFKGETWKYFIDQIPAYFLPTFNKPLALTNTSSAIFDNFYKKYGSEDIADFISDVSKYPNAIISIETSDKGREFKTVIPKELKDHLISVLRVEKQSTPLPEEKPTTVFKKDDAMAAIERLKKKLGGDNNVVNEPESDYGNTPAPSKLSLSDLADAQTVAGYFIESGQTSFTDYAKSMIDALGDGIKPYLKSIYNGVRDFPGMEQHETKMTEYSEVKKADIEQILKPVEEKKSNSFVDNVWKETINKNDVYEIEYKNFAGTSFKVKAKFNDFDGTLISFTDTETGKDGALLPTDIISSRIIPASEESQNNQEVNSDITIQDYSEKSFIVKGSGTKAIKDQLKAIGGAWNGKLGGWIFPKTKREQVDRLVGVKPVQKPAGNLSILVTGGHGAMLKTPSEKYTDAIKQKISSGEKIVNTPKLTQIAENSGMNPGVHYNDIKELYDLASLALNEYIYEQGEKFSPDNKNPDQAREIIKQLNELSDLLPTETQRSSAQVELQQYSTPPSFAFIVNWVAGVNYQDRVLEPSAGEGNIAVFAKATGAKVYVNEYDKNRLSYLRQLGFDKVINEDAKHLHAVNALKGLPITTVVMNPPFSKDVALGGKIDLHAAEKHMDAALAKLEPNGRLVAIVGKGMSMDSPTHKPWWDKIKLQYNVIANIGVNGDAYGKKGTTFDNRLLIIDKNGPTDNKIMQSDVDNYNELIDYLQLAPQKPRINYTKYNNENTTGNSQGQTQRPSQPVQPGLFDNTTTNASGIQRGNEGQPDIESVRPSGNAGGNNQPVNVQRPGGGSNVRPSGSGTASAGNTRPSASQNNKPNQGSVDNGSSVSGNESELGLLSKPDENIISRDQQGGSLSVIRIQKDKTKDTGNIGYDQYSPEIYIEGSQEHPTKLVESSAMASVKLPETNYIPSLSQQKINDGALSKAQLEDVILAGNAHKQILPSGERRGFFLGAGTGYGKGRTIAGILLDNWNKGNKKAVWISKNDKAHRDSPSYWEAVGGDKTKLFIQKNAKTPIKQKEGVLLMTYGTLRSAFNANQNTDQENFWTNEHENRVQQMAQWLGSDFDGVIVFDESHEMANSIMQRGLRGSKKPSAQAMAGIKLQQLLPNAKVIYSSATGATEVSNLVYAQRLGLWGDGTPFGNANEFISAIDNAGVAGMEIISKDLKAMGLYTAKTLSYDGVSYATLQHDLSPEQIELYDKVADSWQVVLRNIQDAIEVNNSDKNAKSAALSAFWGAHQRFFSQIITTMEMPSVIQDIQKNLDDGKAVVVQIVNTNEAQLNRALAESKLDNDEIDYEELDLSPKSTLIEFLRRSFPVAQFEERMDPDGNVIKVPVMDSEGNRVLNPESVAARDRLIETLNRELTLPESPMDMLLNTFGVDNVAEVTGRTKRVVLKMNDNNELVKQEESRSDKHAAQDTNDFMDGKKNMLVFSKAGGTGASFHSDLSRKNQKQRVHYVLQAGWQADAAIQGFGRSHRSNQRIAPVFKLVTTNLKAQMRFLSSIARRLEQLGALTKGQRDTGGQGILDGSYNLENRYAKQALFQFYQDVERGRVRGIDMNVLEEQMALKIYKEKDGVRQYNENVIFDTKAFLNRIMSLRVELMNDVFDGFISRLDEEIKMAQDAGTYDAGIESVVARNIKLINEQEIHTDERTKGKSYLTTFELEIDNNKRDWDTMNQQVQKYGNKFKGFYQENNSEKVYAFIERRIMDANGQSEMRMERRSVVADSFINSTDFWQKYTKLDNEAAKAIWDTEFDEYPDTRKRTETIVKGLILPIWNRLPERISVKRYIDETGTPHLGRFFNANEIRRISEQFEVANTQKYSPEQIKQIIKSNGTVKLANGFEFVKGTYQGLSVIKINNTVSYRDRERLTRAGAMFNVTSAMSMNGTFAIPMDRASEVIEEIERLYNSSVVSAEDSEGNFIPAKNNNQVNEPLSDYLARSKKEVQEKRNTANEPQAEYGSKKNISIVREILGEYGARNLDRAEEATTRLDNLQVAREMETAGKDAKTIRLATGWEKGVDGLWRYEVPDGEFKNIKYSLSEIMDKETKLSDIWDDKELFTAYPKLGNITIKIDNNSGYGGSFSKEDNSITLNLLKSVGKKGQKSTLLHEIQHAIQYIEGFAKGGNTEMFSDKIGSLKKEYQNYYHEYSFKRAALENGRKSEGEYDIEFDGIYFNSEILKKDIAVLENKINKLIDIEKSKWISPNEAYKRLSGEVESRNVQTRMNFTPEERRNTLLQETEDVSREDQIIIMEGLEQKLNSDYLRTQEKPSDNEVNQPQRNYKTKEGETLQYSLFSDTDNGSGAADLQRQVDRQQNPTLRKLRPGERSSVEMKYSLDKNFVFDGRNRIESTDDVAYLFKNLESKSVENMFACFVKDGKPTIVHMSMGNAHGTVVNFNVLADGISRFSPDKVYLIHNHPSGNLRQSQADMDIHNKAIDAFGEVIGEHIIINLTSGEYATFRRGDSSHRIEERPTDKSNSEKQYKVYNFDKQVFKQDAVLPTKITQPDDVAAFISSQRFTEGNKLSALMLDRNNNIKAYLHLSDVDFTSQKAVNELTKELQAYVGRFGSSSIILSGTRPTSVGSWNNLRALKAALKNSDVTLLDYVSNVRSAYSYDSISNDGLLEPQALYGKSIPLNEVLEEGKRIVSEKKPNTILINGIPRPTLNSNGKPIAATEEDFNTRSYYGAVDGFKPANWDQFSKIKQFEGNGKIKGLLNHIINTTTDSNLKRVAEVLLKNSDKSNFIEFEIRMPRDNNDYPIDAFGVYRNGKITISEAAFSFPTNLVHKNGLDGAYKVILHELIHAHTLDSYRNPKTIYEKQFRDYINKVYSDLKSNAEFKKGLYGFSKPTEFISEIVTNPEFQKLAHVYRPNLLVRIAEHITNIFGYSLDVKGIESKRSKKVKDSIEYVLSSINNIRSGLGKKSSFDSATGNNGSFNPDDNNILNESEANYNDRSIPVDQFIANAKSEITLNKKTNSITNAAKAYVAKPAEARTLKQKLQAFRDIVQEKDAPVWRWISELKKQGATIRDADNPFMLMKLAPGRMQSLFEKFEKEMINPLIEIGARIEKATGSKNWIEPYLIALHAPERNASKRVEELERWQNENFNLEKWIETENNERKLLNAKELTEDEIQEKIDEQYELGNYKTPKEVEAKWKELEEMDFSGILPMNKDENGEVINQDFEKDPDGLARSMVNDFEGMVPAELVLQLKEARTKLTDKILQNEVEANKMSQIQANEYRTRWENYIPLRGWLNDASKQFVYTKGNKGAGSINKHAKGRGSMAESPLGYIYKMGYQSTNDKVQGEIKHALLRMAATNLDKHLDGMLEIKQAYFISTGELDENNEEIWTATTVKPTEEQLESGSVIAKRYSGHMKNRAFYQSQEHEVLVDNPSGRTIAVVFDKTNPDLLEVAQSFNHMNMMMRVAGGEANSAEALNSVIQFKVPGLNISLRDLANLNKAMFTQFNLQFPVTNLPRDFFESNFDSYIVNGKPISLKTNAQAVIAIDQYLRGKKDTTGLRAMVEAFYENGGTTGHTRTRTPEEYQKDILGKIKKLQKNGLKKGTVEIAKEWLTRWNQRFEDGIRFSVFMNEIKAGKTPQQAAFRSRNATVDFNIRGKLSPVLGFMWGFFEVSANALAKTGDYMAGKGSTIGRSVKDPKIQRRAMYSAVFMMALGFVDALLNDLLLGDDDDENKYYNRSRWMRHNYINISIPNSKLYVPIPLPPGWRAFKGFGAVVYDYAFGQRGKIDIEDAAWQSVQNFVDGYSPVPVTQVYNSENKEWQFGSLVTPLIFKPIYEIQTNRNYMGLQIAKEPFTKEQEDLLASHSLSKENTGVAAKYLADLAWKMGGGDTQYNYKFDKNSNRIEINPVYDWNPSKLSHFVQGYGGGTFIFFGNILTTVQRAINPDEEIDLKHTPFVSAILKKTGEAKWETIKEYHSLSDGIKGMGVLSGEYMKRIISGEKGATEKYINIEGDPYLQNYKALLDSNESIIKDLAQNVDYRTGEGEEAVITQMKSTIEEIKKLKKQYNK